MLEDHLSYPYQPGGSLPPDAPTYVVRQADDELLQSLITGKYCYVLNSRQMGKSSLRIRTMGRLRQQGIACAEVELSGIGSQQITAQQWYGGIIQDLISGFRLKLKRREWLREHDDLSPVQRLSRFIETVLLVQIKTSLVIFIDEIDSVLGLSFPTDEFFALLRYCYDRRATHPDYNRLTFALLGVATPSDLIRDKQSTPFNIGHAIELKGFCLEEGYPLLPGLQKTAARPLGVLKAILDWTGGQPFLTQKLCWLVSTGQYITAGDEEKYVTQLVQSHLIDNWEAQDEPEHLRTIRDRLLRNSSQSHRLLSLYRQILLHGKLRARNLPEYFELRLSGLVVKHQGWFVVFNAVYREVFNHQWIETELAEHRPIPQRMPLWSALVAALLITAGCAGLRSLGIMQRWELQSFDQLMRLRPPEPTDSRLLIVQITAEDVQNQGVEERGVASLSERSLNQLLQKLQAARGIGLDIYRDYPVSSQLPALQKRLQQSSSLVAICHYGSPGVKPAPELPPQSQGFNNVLKDADQVIRRQLLAVQEAKPCANRYSFAFQLALRYLRHETLNNRKISVEITADDYLKVGQTIFRPLHSHSGGYHDIDAQGHQIMLNYRNGAAIAETVTLGELLGDDFDLSRVKERLVLIGATDPSFNDISWQTPLSGGAIQIKTVSGVEVQAQMVSQLLSAVLEQRPLLWNLSEWGELLWIFGWAATAALMVHRIRLNSHLALVGGSMILILSGSCWLILVTHGGWLPLIPAAGAVVATGITVLAIRQGLDSPQGSRILAFTSML